VNDLGVIAASTEASVAAGEVAFRAGGKADNAVDAAVAAELAATAGEAAITSCAGGGVLLFHERASGETRVCEFFANAPGLGATRASPQVIEDPVAKAGRSPTDFAAIEVEFLEGGTRQTFHIGRGAAAVPALLPGLQLAASRWGKLPLEELLAPARRYVEEGLRLTSYQAECLRVLSPILRRSSLGRRRFLQANGQPLEAGALFRLPELARTFATIQDESFHAWHRQLWTPKVVEEFGESRGGCLTTEDLEQYEPLLQTSQEILFGGARVHVPPAPGVGGRFVAQTLRLFEAASLSHTRPDSPERLRRLAAVFRTVSEARALDPALLDNPDVDALLDARLEHILRSGQEPDPEASTGQEPRLPGNTTHISVADAIGNVVGVTISHGEGNGHEVGDSGVFMNNFLGEEDLFPAGFFRFDPGARLQTMMCPAVVLTADGSALVLGSGGSNRIRTVIPQVLTHLVTDGCSLPAAVKAGRIHFESGTLSVESFRLPDETALASAAELASEVRQFEAQSLFFGGVHVAVAHADGRLDGAADGRRGGVCRVVGR